MAKKRKPQQVSFDLGEEITLKEAKDWLRKIVMDGKAALCPLCTQNAKIYDRPITVQMAQWMIALVKIHVRTKQWVHVKEIAALVNGSKIVDAKKDSAGSGEFAKMRYWDLIVARPIENDETKTSSGFWKPTMLGIDFVYNRVAVKSHAKIYDTDLMYLFDKKKKRVTITDALGKKFNYRDLMDNAL